MKAKGSSANETGLLEYLEEIIGSDKYMHDINRLAEQLENATTQRDTMQRRLRAIEQETKTLESGKGEAEVYLRKKAEILVMKIQRNTHALLQLKVNINCLSFFDACVVLEQRNGIDEYYEGYRGSSKGLGSNADRTKRQSSEAECIAAIIGGQMPTN